jgi:hypothetical protein
MLSDGKARRWQGGSIYTYKAQAEAGCPGLDACSFAYIFGLNKRIGVRDSTSKHVWAIVNWSGTPHSADWPGLPQATGRPLSAIPALLFRHNVVVESS